MKNIQLPKVSVLVITYNHGSFIEDCLRGIIEQDYQGEIEIIVSDDCSTDNTWDVVKRFVNEHPNFNYILNRNDKNIGIGANVNELYTRASGDIWVGQDGDDISLPNRVSTIVNAYLAHPDVMAIDSNVSFIQNGIISNRSSLSEPILYTIKNYISNTMQTWGCTRTMRRIVYDTYGNLLPNISTGDSVGVLRSVMMGKMMLIPDTLLLYRIHETQISNSVNISSINRRIIFLQYRKDLHLALKKKFISFKDYLCIACKIYKYNMAYWLGKTIVWRYIRTWRKKK